MMAEHETGEKPILTLGAVADTHIPDRVNDLHPRLLPALRAARVDHIVHAGDISVARVLEALRAVAPVTAVRGNRDLLAWRLRMVERLELGGVKIALMHGHGGLLWYLWDKWHFWRDGYRLERYLGLLLRTAGTLRNKGPAQDGGPARVIIFGHTHHPEILWYGDQLLLNPGSASFGFRRGLTPNLALLRIYPAGRLEAEIVPLTGWTIHDRQWVEVEK